MLFVLHSGWTSKIRKPCKKIGDWLILPIPFRRPTNSDRVVNLHVPRWDQFLPCPSKTLKVIYIYTQYSSRSLSNKKVGSCQFWPQKTILRIKKSLQVCLYSSYDMVCWVPLGRHCWILCGLHSFGWKAHVDVTTALAGSRSSVAARHDFANVVAEKMLKSLDSFNQVVVSNMFYFHPNLGKSSNLTNVFQMGWNHQLVFILHHGKW